MDRADLPRAADRSSIYHERVAQREYSARLLARARQDVALLSEIAHTLQIHRQDREVRARSDHRLPDTPDAGTKHLSFIQIRQTISLNKGCSFGKLLDLKLHQKDDQSSCAT